MLDKRNVPILKIQEKIFLSTSFSFILTQFQLIISITSVICLLNFELKVKEVSSRPCFFLYLNTTMLIMYHSQEVQCKLFKQEHIHHESHQYLQKINYQILLQDLQRDRKTTQQTGYMINLVNIYLALEMLWP